MRKMWDLWILFSGLVVILPPEEYEDPPPLPPPLYPLVLGAPP